jgi:hypothetical protein
VLLTLVVAVAVAIVFAELPPEMAARVVAETEPLQIQPAALELPTPEAVAAVEDTH